MNLPWIYLDTSTYLKLFVKEKGSQVARPLVRKSRIISSAILTIECFSSLSRKRKRGELGDKDFNSLVSKIKMDAEYIEILRLTDEILLRAESVALQSDSRTLDSIHIASALIFRDTTEIDLTFVTSDKRQREFADHQGLKTSLVG
jgi:predicted nucleic acid-binding protein